MTALVIPSTAELPAYTAALQRGWSPSTTRDLSGEQLAQIASDPAALLARLVQPDGHMITMPSGETVPALPGTTRWIWDRGFCGTINLRYQPGTTDLPPHVSGHIGYSIVPWRQREGHGTAALKLMLPIAGSLGLPFVIITCDTGNSGSRKVIEANGGVFLYEAEDEAVPGTRKLIYRIDDIPHKSAVC